VDPVLLRAATERAVVASRVVKASDDSQRAAAAGNWFRQQVASASCLRSTAQHHAPCTTTPTRDFATGAARSLFHVPASLQRVPEPKHT